MSDVAKVVGATSSEGFLVVSFI